MAQDITHATCERLIDAAGEVFAELGFRAATVREICQRAEANVAAINYHFGDKERLYNAVIRHTYDCALAQYPYAHPDGNHASAQEKLRHFVRSFMFRLLDLGQGSWHGKLMAREMAEPTGALDDVVATSIRPQFEYLVSVVRDLLPPGTPSADLLKCAHSIVGQCLFYHFARPVLERLSPQPLDRNRAEELTGHILAFSMLALRHWHMIAENAATNQV